MPTPLRTFLRNVAPENIADAVQRCLDDTLNHLQLAHATVGSASELQVVLVAAWRDFHVRWWRCPPNALDGAGPYEWSWCSRVLDEVYGKPDGWRTAVDLSQSGIDRGLYGVAAAFVEELAAKELVRIIEVAAQSFWQPLSVDERLAVLNEYLAEYGHLLPPSLAQAHWGELVLSFPRILKEHPRMLLRFRRWGAR